VFAAPSTTDPATVAIGLLARPLFPDDVARRARDVCARLDAVSWKRLAGRAVHQRVASWVLSNIDAARIEAPAAARRTLRQGAKTLAMRTLASDVLLRRLQPLITGKRPDAMLIKGAVVESRAYPKGVLRPQVDVDIVARPGCMATVMSGLGERGFTRTWTSRSGHDIGMREPDGPGIVEVHRTIVCPYRFAPFASPAVNERLFERAIRNGPGQGDDGRLVPCDVDHTAFLLVHLVEELFTDLRHIADAAAWLRAVEVDPGAVWSVAASWHARRAVATAVAAIAAFDPGALGSGWRAVVSDSPSDLREIAATVSRRMADRWRRAGQRHPRWLEGIGLALHLDDAAWFGLSYLRAPRVMQ